MCKLKEILKVVKELIGTVWYLCKVSTWLGWTTFPQIHFLVCFCVWEISTEGKVKRQPLNSSHTLSLTCWLTSLAGGSCRAFLRVQLDEESPGSYKTPIPSRSEQQELMCFHSYLCALVCACGSRLFWFCFSNWNLTDTGTKWSKSGYQPLCQH